VRLLTSIDSTTGFTPVTGGEAPNAEVRDQRKEPRQICALMFAFVLTAALSGCAAYREYEKCGYGGCPGDAKITAEVQHSLAQHPDLGGTDRVFVETVRHVV
jgi:hypothetical protein